MLKSFNSHSLKLAEYSGFLAAIFLSIISFLSAASLPEIRGLTYSLLIASTISRTYTYPKLNLSTRATLLILIAYLECSFPLFIAYNNVSQVHPPASLSWCLNIGLGLISLMPLGIFAAQRSPKGVPYQDVRFPLSKKYTSFILISAGLCFLTSYLSFSLGITRMGSTHTVLPMKLEPALNLLRTTIFPVFFCILITKSKGRVNISLSSILYLLWLTYEMYIRGSRGVLIIGLFPLVIFLLKKVTFAQLLIMATTCFVIGMSSYAIGDYIRNKEVKKQNFISILNRIDMWGVYSRCFHEIPILIDFKKYFENMSLSERLEKFSNQGGVNLFLTHVIKGHPRGAPHAEGTTTLTDGYAFLGIAGVFLSFLVILLLCVANDNSLIPFISNSEINHSILCQRVWLLLTWGDGLFDFLFSRSIFTIMVFPLGIIAIDSLFRIMPNYIHSTLKNN